MQKRYLFPSPLGDSILITGAKTRGKVSVFGVSVPSRGFNSHYQCRNVHLNDTFSVSVPSRGFNSHYPEDGTIYIVSSLFPSPLGDSILITSMSGEHWRGQIPFPSPLGDSILIT